MTSTPRVSFFRVSNLALIFAVALLIRWAVVPFVYDEWMQPYYIGHWEQGNVARALATGIGFGSSLPSSQLSATMTPIFPLIVAFFFKFFGVYTKNALLATLGLNCIFSASAIYPLYKTAEARFGRKVALWVAWGWAFSPYGIYFSAEWPWSTHLLILCFCWLMYLAPKLEISTSLKLWAGFGLLAGFAGLTEPVILPVAAFLVAYAVYRLWRDGKRWFVPFIVVSAALMTTLSPWIIRNALVFHRFIPMRDSLGMELLIGNNGKSAHWVNCDYCPMHNERELAEYNTVGELAYMDHKMQQAKAYIGTHKSWYAWMCWRRALFSWTGFWSFDAEYLKEEDMDVYNVPVCTTLTLLGCLGVWLAWKRNRRDAIRYAGVFFVYPLLYYFVNPGAYRMRPLDPIIWTMAAYAICSLLSLRKPRNIKA